MTAAVELNSEDEEHSSPRERPFKPYRRATSEQAREVVEEATRLILNYEAHFRTRKNKRRRNDQITFEETVGAILSDLIYSHTLGYSEGIHISRSNRVLAGKSRYRPKVYSKMLPYILDLLSTPEMGYVEQNIGVKNGPNGARRTVITTGATLLSRIDEYSLGLDDVRLLPGEEPIVLKRLKADFWDEGGKLEYDDTDATLQYRREVEEINAWLAKSPIDIYASGLNDAERVLDVNDRGLRRVFTLGRFDKGGRLFGGFWQPMSKDERKAALTIGGEPVVELDFGQAGARILYGMAEQTPPNTDLYSIPGYQKQRKGIKKVMSAMMFNTGRLERLPKGTRPLFRRKDKVDDIQDEIEQRHPLVSHLFYKGIGHDIQFTESQIMVSILLQLKKLGIVVLPIHDAVMAPASKAHVVREVMQDTFLRMTGVPSLVTLEQ